MEQCTRCVTCYNDTRTNLRLLAGKNIQDLTEELRAYVSTLRMHADLCNTDYCKPCVRLLSRTRDERAEGYIEKSNALKNVINALDNKLGN